MVAMLFALRVASRGGSEAARRKHRRRIRPVTTARAGCIGAVMVQARARFIAGTAVIEPERDAP